PLKYHRIKTSLPDFSLSSPISLKKKKKSPFLHPDRLQNHSLSSSQHQHTSHHTHAIHHNLPQTHSHQSPHHRITNPTINHQITFVHQSHTRPDPTNHPWSEWIELKGRLVQ
ncbi:hypothetical protein CFOL_v3_08597, partial [Cephalotus follicularis]